MSFNEENINFKNAPIRESENKLDEVSPILTLGTLAIMIIFCMMIGVGLILGLGQFLGMDIQDTISNLSAESSPAERNFIRWNLLINHLTTFIIPAVIFSIFLYKKQWLNFLQLNKSPKIANLALAALLIIAAFPFSQFVYWVNMQIPLPEWAMMMEQDTTELVNNLLLVAEPYELLFNLFIIAIIPAIGEELVFRGLIQKKLGTWFRNPHTAIWITAIIFSAIHFQFQGFLPRMVLGAILGYLYFWTSNLWIPIFAHFVFNGFQVVVQYFYQKEMSEINLDEIENVSWTMTFVSIIVVTGLIKLILDFNKNNSSNKLIRH